MLTAANAMLPVSSEDAGRRWHSLLLEESLVQELRSHQKLVGWKHERDVDVRGSVGDHLQLR